MIAGLEDISGGELRIGGNVVNDAEPRDRGIAMVFQNYAFYPPMTIRENIAFGLRWASVRLLPENPRSFLAASASCEVRRVPDL